MRAWSICAGQESALTVLRCGTVANPYDKRKGAQGAESPSTQALRAIKKGLQVSPVTCAAFLKELQAVKGIRAPR